MKERVFSEWLARRAVLETELTEEDTDRLGLEEKVWLWSDSGVEFVEVFVPERYRENGFSRGIGESGGVIGRLA